MTSVITWLEAIVSTIPLPLLEVWGRFSYIVGLVLAICAFGGFTFRIGELWGFGRERQTWDARAFLSLPLTFVLIIATGYIGSFIVFVAGAQTFESLKDLVVLLCIVLLGYPALIFEKFGTVAARQESSYHSVGLGLAFCKLAIEAHGGTIGVDSGIPAGSTFWFELPA
jgi:hypothetical protein